MNLRPDALRKYFLRNNSATSRRQIKNRDKFVLGSGGWHHKNRFYLQPSAGELNKRKEFIPAPGCDWQFVLYRTAIVTVSSDGIVRLDTGGYMSAITFKFMSEVTPFVFFTKHFNEYTRHLVVRNSHHKICGYFDGIEFKYDQHGKLYPINAKPLEIYRLNIDDEVRTIQRNLRAIKARYMPLAQLHAATDTKTEDPFAGIRNEFAYSPYEKLCAETEATAKTYVELVGWSGPHRRNFKPINQLNNTIKRIRKELYRHHHLVVEKQDLWK